LYPHVAPSMLVSFLLLVQPGSIPMPPRVSDGTRISSARLGHGKGITDVEKPRSAPTWPAAFPQENALLSPDLREGIFAGRTRHRTYVELFDGVSGRGTTRSGRRPATPVGARRHGNWTFPSFSKEPPTRRGDRIPLIGRWKMLDNLRRTLFGAGAWLTLIARLDTPPTPQSCGRSSCS